MIIHRNWIAVEGIKTDAIRHCGNCKNSVLHKKSSCKPAVVTVIGKVVKVTSQCTDKSHSYSVDKNIINLI